jgi:hypothetical protein
MAECHNPHMLQFHSCTFGYVVMMTVSGCIPLFHLCVFVTCFQEMFVVVHDNLTGTYFQEMFVFQVPGKNVKWKASLILQNKLNFILFQHLQTTAYSFFFHQSVPTEFLIQTSTQSKFFPQAFARSSRSMRMENFNQGQISYNPKLKDETETGQQECKDSYHMQTGWLPFGAYTIAHSDMLGVQRFHHFRADVPRCCSYTN